MKHTMIPIKEPKMPINLLNGKYTFCLFFIIFNFERTTAIASAIIHLYVFRFRSVNILPVVFIIYNKKESNIIFRNRFQFFKITASRIFEVGPPVLSNTMYLLTGGESFC